MSLSKKTIAVAFLQTAVFMSVVFVTFYAIFAWVTDIEKLYLAVAIAIVVVFCYLWVSLARWMESRVTPDGSDVNAYGKYDVAPTNITDPDEKAFCKATLDEKEMLYFSTVKSNNLVELAFAIQGDLLQASKIHSVELCIPIFGRLGTRVNPIKNMRERVSELRSITRRNKDIANQIISNLPQSLQVVSKPEVTVFRCETEAMQSLCDGLVIVSTQLDDTEVCLQKMCLSLQLEDLPMCLSLQLEDLPTLTPNSDWNETDYGKLNFMLYEVEARLLHLKALLAKINQVTPS